MRNEIKPLPIDVVAAVLKHENKFLIAKRNSSQSFPLKWEFPGGKVEKGESFEKALIREINEELTVEIKVLEKIGLKLVNDKMLNISVHYFYGKICSGVIKLTEHTDFKWVKKNDFKSYDFIIGDKEILPLIL